MFSIVSEASTRILANMHMAGQVALVYLQGRACADMRL